MTDISPIFTVAIKAEVFPCWPQNILIFQTAKTSAQNKESRPRYPTNYGNSRSPLSLSPVDENQELLRSPWTSLGILLLTNKTGQSFPKQSSPSQKDSNPLMLQQTILVHQLPSVTSVKSFHGQICSLSWVLCFTFQPCSTITKQSWYFSGDHSLSKWVHTLNKSLLKAFLHLWDSRCRSTGAGRTNFSYNALEIREKIKETEMWQHWNSPKHKEVKIRFVMRKQALEIIHLQWER